MRLRHIRRVKVAPFTGAWIEIGRLHTSGNCSDESHPSRVRGLKYYFSREGVKEELVAPFTGAWIEITALNRRRTR